MMTTGYTDKLSHSGANEAAGEEYKLKCFAALSNSPVDEMKGETDFWLCDRTGDYTNLLQHLSIGAEKMIKC